MRILVSAVSISCLANSNACIELDTHFSSHDEATADFAQPICRMGRMAIDETLRFLRGGSLEQEVTRDMLPTQA